MRSRRVRTPLRLTLVSTALLLLPAAPAGQAHTRTYALTCGVGRTMAHAINSLKPGDTLVVTGTCNENLVIGPEVHRITLDGRGTATINGDPTAHAITISGTGITIRGFVITGGSPQAINVQDGGSALIDGNTIRSAERNGIGVFRNSSADIVNNTIEQNPLAGITVQSNSSARIGWLGPPTNRVSMPNTIQNNGTQGIRIYGGASAQIFSNTIQNNGSHGVSVERNAQAEIAACTIIGNVGDGIRGMRGAAIDLGTDATNATPQFDDDTNTGSNAGFGVRCMLAGFVDGRLGALSGVSGPKNFTELCVDSLVP